MSSWNTSEIAVSGPSIKTSYRDPIAVIPRQKPNTEYSSCCTVSGKQEIRATACRNDLDQ